MSDYDTVWHGATHRTFTAPTTVQQRILDPHVAAILEQVTDTPRTIRAIARTAKVSMRIAGPILAGLWATGSIDRVCQIRERTGRAVLYRRTS